MSGEGGEIAIVELAVHCRPDLVQLVATLSSSAATLPHGALPWTAPPAPVRAEARSASSDSNAAAVAPLSPAEIFGYFQCVVGAAGLTDEELDAMNYYGWYDIWPEQIQLELSESGATKIDDVIAAETCGEQPGQT